MTTIGATVAVSHHGQIRTGTVRQIDGDRVKIEIRDHNGLRRLVDRPLSDYRERGA